jgi:hypothetical protein
VNEDKLDFDAYIDTIEDPLERERRRKDAGSREFYTLYMALSDEGRKRMQVVCKRIAALPVELREQMTDEQVYQYLGSESGDSLN